MMDDTGDLGPEMWADLTMAHRPIITTAGVSSSNCIHTLLRGPTKKRGEH